MPFTFRKLRRAIRKVGGPAARLAIASLTGGASEAAMRVAKGIGAYSAKRAAKIQPASVTALIDRTVSNTAPMQPARDQNALTMPGGAPLPQMRLKVARPRKPRAARRLKLPSALSAELAGQGTQAMPPAGYEKFARPLGVPRYD